MKPTVQSFVYATLSMALALAPAVGRLGPEQLLAAPVQERVLETQFGQATYYGRHFDGKRTASGRLFDKDRAVAAHRTYPFGTVVRVTNMRNGRSINVVIVDRGPYGKNHREGAIIDLSPEAAKRLGMLHRGQIDVKLEVLRWGDGEYVSKDRP